MSLRPDDADWTGAEPGTPFFDDTLNACEPLRTESAASGCFGVSQMILNL